MRALPGSEHGICQQRGERVSNTIEVWGGIYRCTNRSAAKAKAYVCYSYTYSSESECEGARIRIGIKIRISRTTTTDLN